MQLWQMRWNTCHVDEQSYESCVPEEDVLQLAELRGGVPAPLVETLANGNEVRTHTRYAVNPVTGETEVIPFIDTATGRVVGDRVRHVESPQTYDTEQRS